jgi:hypothetical protein
VENHGSECWYERHMILVSWSGRSSLLEHVYLNRPPLTPPLVVTSIFPPHNIVCLQLYCHQTGKHDSHGYSTRQARYHIIAIHPSSRNTRNALLVAAGQEP